MIISALYKAQMKKCKIYLGIVLCVFPLKATSSELLSPEKIAPHQLPPTEGIQVVYKDSFRY